MTFHSAIALSACNLQTTDLIMIVGRIIIFQPPLVSIILVRNLVRDDGILRRGPLTVLVSLDVSHRQQPSDEKSENHNDL